MDWKTFEKILDIFFRFPRLQMSNIVLKMILLYSSLVSSSPSAASIVNFNCTNTLCILSVTSFHSCTYLHMSNDLISISPHIHHYIAVVFVNKIDRQVMCFWVCVRFDFIDSPRRLLDNRF